MDTPALIIIAVVTGQLPMRLDASWALAALDKRPCCLTRLLIDAAEPGEEALHGLLALVEDGGRRALDAAEQIALFAKVDRADHRRRQQANGGAEQAQPTQLCQDLPQTIEGVILRALRRKPTERYSNAQEMLDALLKLEKSPTAQIEDELATVQLPENSFQ